jgi:hypothetical protein
LRTTRSMTTVPSETRSVDRVRCTAGGLSRGSRSSTLMARRSWRPAPVVASASGGTDGHGGEAQTRRFRQFGRK